VSATTRAGAVQVVEAEGQLTAEAATAGAAAATAAAVRTGGLTDPAVERAVEANLARLLGELRELHGGGLAGIDARFKEWA
jgi:hypothetical protein